MKVLNQYGRYITEDHLIEKIEHMIRFGYGSFKCDNGLIASYDYETQDEDGERIVFIRVEGKE